jgi:hypothetical protein
VPPLCPIWLTKRRTDCPYSVIYLSTKQWQSLWSLYGDKLLVSSPCLRNRENNTKRMCSLSNRVCLHTEAHHVSYPIDFRWIWEEMQIVSLERKCNREFTKIIMGKSIICIIIFWLILKIIVGIKFLRGLAEVDHHEVSYRQGAMHWWFSVHAIIERFNVHAQEGSENVDSISQYFPAKRRKSLRQG